MTSFRMSAYRKQSYDGARRGSILALVAISLVTLVALAGYAINTAYIELTRSELRLANDAAAKAAIITLGRSQSLATARQIAKTVAASHVVAGRTYTLTDSDIQFGSSIKLNSGSYNFTENGSPTNAVRVLAGRNNTNNSMFFGAGSFSLSEDTVATRVDHDLCFVIDRSGSMAWDLTNVKFSYPGDQKEKSRLQNYFTVPHATLSRWASVKSAINTFNSVTALNGLEIKVGLVTYSSDYEFGKYKSVRSTVNRDLTYTTSQIPADMDTIAQKPLIGDTNIEAGLQAAMNLMSTSSASRITATKTIVLLSDGVKTQGGDPVAVATAAKAANMKVHTIAFSSQADVTLMQQIAAAGGGTAYLATDTATLRSAFKQIAESIPSMLTE